MLHKTRGIVFRFTKYGETSIIVNIFTESFGLQSYIVNGVRSKSAKNKIALFQPLTLLELVVYNKENANIKRIKELKCVHPFQSLSTDIKKSTMGMFMIEMMNKTIKEESHTGDFFSFLFNSIQTLDLLEENTENFHLIFLLKLSRYLGFGAHSVSEVLGHRMIGDEEEKILAVLLTLNLQETVKMTGMQRKNLLDIILLFYADHLDYLGEIRSVAILREVLDN
jgi:DNA repair protein RecO (recombination protein O)